MTDQVDGLLKASMSAHLRSAQQHSISKDQAGRVTRSVKKERDRDLLLEAYEKRKQAHELDPEHQSPGWQTEQARTNSTTDTHAALMSFYREQGLDG